jgi:predicted RNA-binding protein with PUA-like domain
MAKKYWLMKVEPEAYSVDDFEREGETCWEGVRNYQARNILRDDIKPGDGVLFYQSNADPTGVAAIAEVSRGGYPDHHAFDPKHPYHDPKSDPDNPTWYMVDIRFVERFPAVVTLAELKETKGLEDMMVTRRGMRLSVQPVAKAEFDIVRKLGRAKKPGDTAAPKQKRSATAAAKAKAKRAKAAQPKRRKTRK